MRVEAELEQLMTVAQMAAADAAAPGHGVPSMTLMENAGRAVADEIGRRFTPRVTAVMCGPGNNGGDGFVVARLLKQRGWPVWVEFARQKSDLKGDAAQAFRRWDSDTWFAPPDKPMPDLYVDALFGAGLSRPLTGGNALFAEASIRFPQAIVAIDMPSGVYGDTGQTLGGPAIHAGLTVTFVRKKPGHVLMPGRAHCGEIVCADIGMPERAIRDASRGAPTLGTISGAFAVATDVTAHKYDRGHCLVVSGGPHTTGASRLAAHAAARAGAGLTTIAAPDSATAIHAARLDAIMVRSDSLDDLLKDTRRNALVIGPGLGLDADAETKLNSVLAACRATVLDADALTLIAKTSSQAAPPTHNLCVMTPHGGEFARLFPDLAADIPKTGKLEATRAAAKRAGCVVLFKGADTVISAPDGRSVIDSLAPPSLATAGSGDVLAGLIGGLLAQGLAPFEAACAGVYLHGAAATRLGPGLTADDLPGAIPAILAGLKHSHGRV